MIRTSTFYLSILFVFSSSFIFGQKAVFTIKGQLLDSESKQPIPFASIYLKDKPIGTTTNTEGYFIFHIPDQLKTTVVVISAMGYTSIERKSISFSRDTELSLAPQINQLDEVLVGGRATKVLKAKEIVKKAYKNIAVNYPMEPFFLEGFVRDLQKENETYVEYLECAIKFKYQGVQVKKEPEVELLGVRTNSFSQRHPWNENSERKNSIIDLIEDDFIRFDYGPILGKNGWKYEIAGIESYDNRLVYKISGMDEPFQKAVLYIDTETFAFVRVELTREAKNGTSWQRRFTNGAQQMFYNVIFEYQEYKGKFYLKYQKEEDIWRIYEGQDSNLLLFTKYPKKELFINNIIVDNVDNYRFLRNMDISSSIENQTKNFDAEFWATYNVPRRTAAQSQILRELKK
ncbi:carboxypeptidase-like regulatory domain-containing protein [uncultured Allomuricauda sp.]|uniref:carboxypeptidase-like regulatory domain-containing protein n=1 Tax=Flagellimonas sp. W118 TaxID=3410791 RepID=UPI0026233EC9|nr:carboxypeptidase-like regulatory domain-containing protein [uncultured Allomuricauda sp.]